MFKEPINIRDVMPFFAKTFCCLLTVFFLTRYLNAHTLTILEHKSVSFQEFSTQSPQKTYSIEQIDFNNNETLYLREFLNQKTYILNKNLKYIKYNNKMLDLNNNKWENISRFTIGNKLPIYRINDSSYSKNVFDRHYKYITSFTACIKPSSSLSRILCGMTLDNKSRIYMSNIFNHCIYIYDKKFPLIKKIMEREKNGLNFQYPCDIAADSLESTYIKDLESQKNQVLWPNYGPLEAISQNFCKHKCFSKFFIQKNTQDRNLTKNTQNISSASLFLSFFPFVKTKHISFSKSNFRGSEEKTAQLPLILRHNNHWKALLGFFESYSQLTSPSKKRMNSHFITSIKHGVYSISHKWGRFLSLSGIYNQLRSSSSFPYSLTFRFQRYEVNAPTKIEFDSTMLTSPANTEYTSFKKTKKMLYNRKGQVISLLNPTSNKNLVHRAYKTIPFMKISVTSQKSYPLRTSTLPVNTLLRHSASLATVCLGKRSNIGETWKISTQTMDRRRIDSRL